MNIKCVSNRGDSFLKNNAEECNYVFARSSAPLNVLLEVISQSVRVYKY